MVTRAGLPGGAGSGGLTTQQTEEVRARVRLMIEITARAGAYRKGLLTAAARLSPEEAAIISDLEGHGLQVQQLRDVLCGGHVLVDDPQLCEDWQFSKVSHLRISSHHRDIDKAKHPGIGMRGVVVREKLHGRTAQGTWVRLAAGGTTGRRQRPGRRRSPARLRRAFRADHRHPLHHAGLGRSRRRQHRPDPRPP
jgi:hypothetical protein